MSHKHFCDGKACRPGDAEFSVCRCFTCGLPLERFDHSGRDDPVELFASPEHRKEWRRMVQASREENRRRAAEFGLHEKWERMQSVPEGPEKDALAQQITGWIFPDCDVQLLKA